MVQAQAEAAELAAAGEVIEAERDALAEQVATLTTERDTLAGKAAQQAADLTEAQQRIEREQQASKPPESNSPSSNSKPRLRPSARPNKPLNWSAYAPP